MPMTADNGRLKTRTVVLDLDSATSVHHSQVGAPSDFLNVHVRAVSATTWQTNSGTMAAGLHSL